MRNPWTPKTPMLNMLASATYSATGATRGVAVAEIDRQLWLVGQVTAFWIKAWTPAAPVSPEVRGSARKGPAGALPSPLIDQRVDFDVAEFVDAILADLPGTTGSADLLDATAKEVQSEQIREVSINEQAQVVVELRQRASRLRSESHQSE